MPNWVTNKLTISGEDKYLYRLRDQMSESYVSHHYDIMDNSVTHHDIDGLFLLWNIVRPTNLDAYYEIEKVEERAERIKAMEDEPTPPPTPADVINAIGEGLSKITAESMAKFAQDFERDVATGQDWYHWNIREWGTKWEIDEAKLTQEAGQLHYEFGTAWSPPVPALNKLAAQYPRLTFTIRFLDAGGGFAGEVHWRNGFTEFEADIDINHGLMVEMYGECHACCRDNADDEDWAEYRETLRCAEFGQVINFEEFLK